jgi:hypothetical protein
MFVDQAKEPSQVDKLRPIELEPLYGDSANCRVGLHMRSVVAPGEVI